MLPEVANYLDCMNSLRGQIRELITRVPAEALNWRPIEGDDNQATNSLAVMAAHAAGAEYHWITEVIGRQPLTRQREAEFKTIAQDAAGLVGKLTQTADASNRILADLSAEELAGAREVEGHRVPVRWAILHVIDHTALHLGHMQITYQLWNDGQAIAAPRWFQRLPGQPAETH
jgi:uncharacterized damage-inducible protein DinB